MRKPQQHGRLYLIVQTAAEVDEPEAAIVSQQGTKTVNLVVCTEPREGQIKKKKKFSQYFFTKIYYLVRK